MYTQWNSPYGNSTMARKSNTTSIVNKFVLKHFFSVRLKKCNRFSYTVTRDGTKCWMNNNKKREREKKKFPMKNDKRLCVGCFFLFAMEKNSCILWLLFRLYIFSFGLNICICTTMDAALPFFLKNQTQEINSKKKKNLFFFFLFKIQQHRYYCCFELAEMRIE